MKGVSGSEKKPSSTTLQRRRERGLQEAGHLTQSSPATNPVMQELPKGLKRKLREQSMLAHEEELRRALGPLAERFEQWRQGRVSSGELALVIHDWDRGPQKELFKKYNYGLKDINVAHAIVTGILDEKKVDAALLEYLQRHIAFYREQLRFHWKRNRS